MKKYLICFALVWAFVGLAAERPATWAVKMERAGLPNLHRVDAKLYRSAQPTAEGMTNLVRLSRTGREVSDPSPDEVAR